MASRTENRGAIAMTAARAERDTIDSGKETSMIVDPRFIPLAIKFFRVFRSRRSLR